MQPIRAQSTLEVSAPAKVVYAIFADYVTHHPQVLPKPYFESLEVEEGGVGEGTVIRVGMRVMGARQSLRMRVTEPEPGRRLSETDLDSGAITTFTLDPIAQGEGTRVTISTQWPRKPGPRGWIDSLILPRVARTIYEKELALVDAYARKLSQG